MFRWFRKKQPGSRDAPESAQAGHVTPAPSVPAVPPSSKTGRTTPPTVQQTANQSSAFKGLSELETLKLQIQVRRELEERLRPEIESAIQARHRRELHEASQRTLLNYLVTESGQDAGTFYAKLPDKLRAELDSAVRRQLMPMVEQALRKELREQIRAEETEKLRNEIRHAVVTDERWQAKARQGLRQSMVAQVRAELQDQLRPEIEEQLTRKLSMPLLIDASGQIESSVAAAIQRHLEVCKEEIRSQAVQEVWHQASTAIVEAFAAASTLDDDSLDDAMIAAMDAHETAMLAAYKAYENASVEIDPEDGVRKAVEAALTSLGFTSHCWREHWEWYSSRAKALIHRRFFQSSATSESAHPMDGFYRAIQSYTCDRTGRQIEPGDCYLVFGGLRIALPMPADPAMEWNHESPKSASARLDRRPESWPSPTDKISASKVYRKNP